MLNTIVNIFFAVLFVIFFFALVYFVLDVLGVWYDLDEKRKKQERRESR